MDKHGSDDKLVANYNDATKPVIDTANETTSEVEYAGRKIEIGMIAQLDHVKQCLENLQKVCRQNIDNVKTRKASDIASSQEAKNFFKKYMRRGTCMLELFKDPNCRCAFCNVVPEGSAEAAGHIPYPMLREDRIHSLANDYLPLYTVFQETNVGRHYPNKIRISNSRLLDCIRCYACGKVRCLFGSRWNVPKEKIIWLKNTHGPTYQYQCGEILFPLNNPKHAKFPNEEWHNDKNTCRSLP